MSPKSIQEYFEAIHKYACIDIIAPGTLNGE